ncbi:hypothetical protein KM043_017299 [Ampulex compressa]|nr:hypothetical protein KM043_017299 [Ampulex compressa]
MWQKIPLRNFMFYSYSSYSGLNLSKFTKFQLNSNNSMSNNVTILEEAKACLKDVFHAGIKTVSPKTIIQSKVKFYDKTLYIDDRRFEVRGDIYLVGFGKAVMGMAIALEQLLGNALKKGIVSVPSISEDAIWDSEDKSSFPKLKGGVVDYCAGGTNNQPDDRSLETTHNIIDLIEPLTENDTLIVLVSGGGSALLYMPRPVIDQDDKLQLCRILQNAGADITELNTVRRKLSLVKGGGLARMAYPAQTITLILSDIVGDPLDLIASGPTVYNERAPDEVISILKKYNLFRTLEGDLKTVIMSKETFDDEPLLNSSKEFLHVSNIILANNAMAIEGAHAEVLRKKLTPIILRSDVRGDVHDVSLAYAYITSLICLALEKQLRREEFFEKVRDLPILSLSANKVDEIYQLIESINGGGLILIGGGEPTVTVKGRGKGGRNQELALHFSLDWLAKIKSFPRFTEYDVIILSGGTDGQDGPTDAAGAFGYAAIGPIMHDLYSKMKSLALKELALIKAKKDIKENDKGDVRETCKVQELSGFLSQKTFQKSFNDETTKEISNEKNKDEDLHELTLKSMEVERMLPENTLANNDTYNFYTRFKRGSDIIKTGFTGTNVMDLHFIYIKKRNCDCKVDYKKEYEQVDPVNIHDLHIDPSTMEKYKVMNEPLSFNKDLFLRKPEIPIDSKEKECLNIRIIDDNLADPCCRKERKFPGNKFKSTDLLPH